MLNNKGPLMFINTVNTYIEDTKDQKVYDSRGKKQESDISKKMARTNLSNNNSSKNDNYKDNDTIDRKFIEERKIRNIIEMYHKDRPVLCNVITKDDEIIGVPFKLDDTLLYIKTDDGETVSVKLTNIYDLLIIKL